MSLLEFEPTRAWYGVELTKEKAEIFKEYLREKRIKFEPSECYNLIHIECYLSLDELHTTHNWMERNL